MIRHNRKIQFIILFVLVCLVGTISIAYAVLSTTLNITGTAQVMDASWDVHFSNIQVNPYSVSINPTITDNDKIIFSADLTTPGQFYKFTVDIVNSGSIDAMIESVIKNPELTTDQKKYLRYEVEYIDGASINETQLLKSGETKTISVLVSYRNDIPTTDLPTTETNLTLEIRLVYVQATTIGTEIEGQEKIVKLVSGDLNTIGSEICIKDECFYLIDSDDKKVKLFSKYNLHVGNFVLDSDFNVNSITNFTGIQDNTARGSLWENGTDGINFPWVGTVSFADNNDWNHSYVDLNKSDVSINNYVLNYKKYLESLNISVIDARLLTYQEIVDLGCLFNTSYLGEYSWLCSTSYWLGTSLNDSNIFAVAHGTCFFGANDYYKDYYFGVRPVIEIPLTEF